MMNPVDHLDAISTVPEPAEVELATMPRPSAAKKVSDTDPFLVEFDPTYDPENPLDWPKGRKWMVTDVLSATGFNRIMVSTIMAPALSTIADELSMSPTEAAMSLSIYLLATAFGPLFIGPLSEIYGRTAVLHGSNVWFLIWNIVCGFAKTKETLIASRFLAGFGASAIYALAGGVLGDVWRPEQRGRSLGMYLLVPLLGAAVGPIIGGFMAGRTTWRWMFWATSIFQGVMIAVSFLSFRETYGPLILHRRAEGLRKQHHEPRYHTLAERLDRGHSRSGAVLARALSRPVRLLLRHPIIQVSALLSGFDYGIMYVTLSTFSEIWTRQYGQSIEISGLHYIGVSLGEIVASLVGGRLLDYLYKRKAVDPQPESRLPVVIPAFTVAWAGVLMYGWTAQYRLSWLVVDLGVFIMMFGMQLGGMPTTAYVIDAYGEHTSSAMASQQFVRSLMAFCFPLFAPSLYDTLGYGWGNSVMAFTGFALAVPIPLYLYRYGPSLRARAKSTY